MAEAIDLELGCRKWLPLRARDEELVGARDAEVALHGAQHVSTHDVNMM